MSVRGTAINVLKSILIKVFLYTEIARAKLILF